MCSSPGKADNEEDECSDYSKEEQSSWTQSTRKLIPCGTHESTIDGLRLGGRLSERLSVSYAYTKKGENVVIHFFYLVILRSTTIPMAVKAPSKTAVPISLVSCVSIVAILEVSCAW